MNTTMSRQRPSTIEAPEKSRGDACNAPRHGTEGSSSMQAENKHWRYVVDAETGCWLWQGALNNNGYPLWERSGGNRTAHREFYVLHVGPIPAGYHLHHTCATKHCVNPAHLTPLTPREHNRADAPFAEQEEHARSLRESGLSYVRIADELGCSRTTAYRLVNPAYHELDIRYKQERPEHYRGLRVAYHKRLMEESPNRCVECGAGMNPRGKRGGRCIACRTEQSKQRRETIQRLWSEGRSLPEIAGVLNTTVNSVGQTMVLMRRDGWNLPLRYRMTDGRRVP